MAKVNNVRSVKKRTFIYTYIKTMDTEKVIMIQNKLNGKIITNDVYLDVFFITCIF